MGIGNARLGSRIQVICFSSQEDESYKKDMSLKTHILCGKSAVFLRKIVFVNLVLMSCVGDVNVEVYETIKF